MITLPGMIVAGLVGGIVYVAILCVMDDDIRNIRLGIIILLAYSAIAINWAVKVTKKLRK